MANAEPHLRDHAYTSFTRKLLDRDIEPGQIVSQRELVALTGMPLGAIREMIPRLEADGLIETVPKRGLKVLSIDLNLIRNAFQLRRIIEREAFEQFCDEGKDDEIEKMVEDHRSIREEALKGVDADLLARAQHMDWAFHDHVIDALGNELISSVHRVNAIKIRLIRNADTRMLPELVVSVLDEHLAVIYALQARNRARTVSAIHAHIDSAKRRALSL
ncbi:GntR family transcriptional regulator [Psychromarinibacter halotolerans]|uniref:GntR family transcriptional regulator n=1 Tax=Psychromarinibacter halotolerans TaxID=1775175 RepID=A0ABV7GWT6_9RHOB|nr:GntR family transcriptional regulator [Psychromarinibacter halotolerans]MDF0597414.1 GntR family transcriptional regulator [Psychromarinibacter halotolerans]